MNIDDKIKEIAIRRKFTNFWECFDYLVLANYDEMESILFSLELFNGNVWDKVLAAKVIYGIKEDVYCSNWVIGSIGGVDPAIDFKTPTNDEQLVEIYFMTSKANELYKPAYKAYIETREHEMQSVLEGHIKSITIKLTTDLAIKMFNDGYKNF